MDARSRTDTVSAEELSKVHNLGRLLFLNSSQGSNYWTVSSGDDEPAVIVRRLEESAKGCRWLLDRWAELRHILDLKASWTDPEMLRFVGLLGKHSMEAVFDPKLNSLFLAFDALDRRFGQEYWKSLRDKIPASEHGFIFLKPWRELGPRPRDKAAALAFIRSVIDEHVDRLKELLAEHEEIEADEATERCDRAALDCSPAFERHRRYQSARHRELLQTLEAFRKMRNAEFGTGNGEIADGKRRTADDGCEVRSGGCGDGQSGEPRPQAPSEEMSQEDWDLVYGPSWPRSQANIFADTSGGCGEGEPETVASESGGSGERRVAPGGCEEGERERNEPTQEECLTPQKAPNEAKLESTQSSSPLEVESSATEPAGRKRSQSRRHRQN